MESKPHLPTRWLFFYTYILLPFNILFSFGLPLAEQEKLLEQGIRTQINPMVFVLIIIVSMFISFVIYGLHKRRLWGWTCNWGFLVGTTLMGPMNTAPNISTYFVAIMLLSVTYLLPNYIYFKKRRYLFDPLAAQGSPTKIPWIAVAATTILILALLVFFKLTQYDTNIFLKVTVYTKSTVLLERHIL